jgi:hypothetical protein
VLLRKLIATQHKKSPALYGTSRLITVFTRTHHWNLSWARWIQSTPFHRISLKFIPILSFHLRLGLPSGLFPSVCHTKMLYIFLISFPCVLHHPPIILLDLITPIVFKLLFMQSSSVSSYFLPFSSKWEATWLWLDYWQGNRALN